MEEKSVILFDGVCNLCNGFINFLIPRDKHNRFQFGSLQSARAKELLGQFGVHTDNLSTVMLIEDGKLYKQSTAVLKILRHMGSAWPMLYVFIVLPKSIRDFFYNLIARNRYTLFGKKDSCMMPTPELKAKFIE